MASGLAFDRTSLTSRRSHPNYWFNKAADLRTAAGAAWYAMRYQPDDMNDVLGLPNGNSALIACTEPYHLLCGLALEVLFKAIIAQRESPPESHDLVHLAKTAGISLSAKDNRLLMFYQAALVWSGRYPIPRQCTDEKLLNYYRHRESVIMRPALKLGGIQLYKAGNATHWENFHSMWLRFAKSFSFQP